MNFEVGQEVGGKRIKAIHNRAAEGEVTGHAHRIDPARGTVLEFEDGSRELYVMSPEGAPLSHEEHKPITLDYGQYEIKIVKEKDPMEDLVRNVAD